MPPKGEVVAGAVVLVPKIEDAAGELDAALNAEPNADPTEGAAPNMDVVVAGTEAGVELVANADAWAVLTAKGGEAVPKVECVMEGEDPNNDGVAVTDCPNKDSVGLTEGEGGGMCVAT